MQQEWFSAKELVNIGELCNSVQGINKRARKENWQRRQRKGKQGIAYEYHISSLPPLTRSLLQGRVAAEKAPYYDIHVAEIQPYLLSYFELLSAPERDILLHFLAKKGINGLLSLIKTQEHLLE